ncbi:MAG: hypothetical protein IJA61_01690 [Clostridia bacterium]|nr:hypothetical protein [Clostridia bacterium]
MKKNKSCSLSKKIENLFSIDYKKNAKFLILIPVILIALSVIITYFFGLNYATELRSKYEFTVDFGKQMVEEDIETYKTKIDYALENNSLTAVKYTKYGESLYTGFVVTISPEHTCFEEDQLTEIKESIEEYLQTNVADTVEVSDIELTVNTISSFVWRAVLALAIAAVAVFIYMWIRFNLMHALTGVFATVFNALLVFIIYALFRLPFGYASLAVMFFSVVLGLVLVVYAADKIKNMEVAGEKLTNNEYVKRVNVSITNGLICPIVVILAIVMIMAIVLLFVNAYVASTLFALLLGALVAMYSAMIAANSFWTVIYNIDKDNRLRARIDRQQKRTEKKAAKKEKVEEDKVVV